MEKNIRENDIKNKILNNVIKVFYNDKYEYHREDGPAIEYSYGTKEWHKHGQRHREDGPAIEYANGNKEWFLNGLRHREDGPAIEWPNGYKEWWINGEFKKQL